MRHVGFPIPQLGIEPVPPALEAQSLNHWTTREILWGTCYTIIFPAAIPRNANAPVWVGAWDFAGSSSTSGDSDEGFSLNFVLKILKP